MGIDGVWPESMEIHPVPLDGLCHPQAATRHCHKEWGLRPLQDLWWELGDRVQ